MDKYYNFGSARRGWIYHANGALFCVTKEKYSLQGIVMEVTATLKRLGYDVTKEEILESYADAKLIKNKYYFKTLSESRPHKIKPVG